MSHSNFNFYSTQFAEYQVVCKKKLPQTMHNKNAKHTCPLTKLYALDFCSAHGGEASIITKISQKICIMGKHSTTQTEHWCVLMLKLRVKV